jgi:Sin3 associated polypeptide p18 (SAP18)
MDVDADPTSTSTPHDTGTAMDIVGKTAATTRDKVRFLGIWGRNMFTERPEQTAPFLIRAFVKVGGFHRLNAFEDGVLPTADEHQVFTWYVKSSVHSTEYIN